MTDGAVLERHDHLPPDPASASAARRLVVEALAATSFAGTEVADAAVLLVSEVVSNAVLHAGTGIRVTVRVGHENVRVEVRDGSVVVPAVRHYTGAATGRGMELVDLLASAWGTDQDSTGKVVWFEVRADRTAGSAERGPEPVERTGPMWTCVSLLGLPTALVQATFQYGDAAIRELALLSFSEGGNLPEVAIAPRLDLGALATAVETALHQGVVELDLELDFPPSAEQAAIDRLSAVDEAERLASEDRLLLLPAVPEIAMCQRWFLGQISLQLQGHPPTPWQLPETDDVHGEVTPLSGRLAAEIDAIVDAVVVADTGNRIVHLNAAGAVLFGWEPDALVGRRLTTIIPPEHRAAHLAGFTRFQLTGEGPLIGAAVEVPVLRRDGSVARAVLAIELLERGADGRAFLARFSPPTDGARTVI